LLAHARAEAGHARDQAVQDAATLLESARAEVEAQVSDARRRGEADGRALLRAARARLDRQCRTAVLEAQRRVYDELVERAAEAVRSRLTDPTARRRLEDRIHEQLGPAAEIVDSQDGGVRAATADGIAVDASVRALVENALRGLDLEQLWAAAG
jgi:vacuolar-type H+-ATPase subunit E/Vma4